MGELRRTSSEATWPPTCRAELIRSHPGLVGSYKDMERAVQAVFDVQSAETKAHMSNISDKLWGEATFFGYQDRADLLFHAAQGLAAGGTSSVAAWGEMCAVGMERWRSSR